mmetsp:Transcript_35093/g.81491  ORF Transcript_35093/g.81491 Transcript_35093/m.81491 type:complete len:279 (+) Transcript_35093:85-921(+)
MHNDESIWFCLSENGCSFKVKMKKPNKTFCRNEYNVTGICEQVVCPLANSQYATVLEQDGISYLYMKTVERAHSPKNLWERVKLSRNFLYALEQISKHLEYWPDHMINRCKQRLTKIRQMLIRMRKLSLKGGPKLVPIKKKTERREMTRELKAEAAAKVDLAIEKELLERLKQGTYGDIYNFPKQQFDQALEKETEVEEEKDGSETEFVEDLEEEEEEEESDMDVGKVELVEFNDEPDDGIADLEDMDELAPSQPRKRRRSAAVPRVELEYEEEVNAT